MDITAFSAYSYFFLTVFMTVILYAYIYHLYKNKKSADGVDYEEYAKLALDDDINDKPIYENPKRKKVGEKDE